MNCNYHVYTSTPFIFSTFLLKFDSSPEVPLADQRGVNPSLPLTNTTIVWKVVTVHDGKLTEE